MGSRGHLVLEKATYLLPSLAGYGFPDSWEDIQQIIFLAVVCGDFLLRLEGWRYCIDK